MDTWKVFCAKYKARKQEVLVKQKQERLALLEKHKAELEHMDQAHKETLEELKELFEKDRVQRKQLVEKKSKKASVLSLKKRSCKIEYLESSLSEKERDDDDDTSTQKIQEPLSRQSSITKYLKKKLSRAAESIEIHKKRATFTVTNSQIPSTQGFYEMPDKCHLSEEDEEICRILNQSEKIEK
jgi:hypothetical protein